MYIFLSFQSMCWLEVVRVLLEGDRRGKEKIQEWL